MARSTTIPRILFFNRSFYFDSTNGAAVASRRKSVSGNRCAGKSVSVVAKNKF